MNEKIVDNWLHKIKQEYKNNFPSQRHNGFTRVRLLIMDTIYRISKLSKEMDIPYKGVARNKILGLFTDCNISHHTVRDNIDKLVKLGYLKKFDDDNRIYYDLSDKHFLCRDGVYIIYDREMKIPNLFALTCPRYPFCTLKEEDCGIGYYVDDFKKLAEIFIDHTKKENIGWQKPPVDMNEWLLKKKGIIRML